MIRAILNFLTGRTVRSSMYSQFMNSARGNFAARFYSGSTWK